MDLKKLTDKLFEETSSIFEAVSKKTVSWEFPAVTIIQAGGGPPPDGPPGPPPGPGGSDVENLDPPPPAPPQPPKDPEDGDGGDGEPTDSDDVKPGNIIQDMDTGEYGRVSNVSPTGDITWEPVSKAELEQQGYLAKKAGVYKPTPKMTKLNKGMLDGFIG